MDLTFNPFTGKDERIERASFTCPGCGSQTVIHIGGSAVLTEQRCLKCRGSLRGGRGATPPTKGRIGTHMGSLKTAERRAVKRAAAQRNRMRRAGLRAKNGTTYREPCRSYDTCSHRKHSVAKGRGY